MAGTERSRMRRLLYRWGRTEGTCALWMEEMERLRADSARRAQRSAESVQSMSEAFSNREAQRLLEALEEDCRQELRFKHCMDDLIRTLEPQDRLLLETDCPYLTPVPIRKDRERNLSGYLNFVVDKISEIKGLDSQEIEDITWKNAHLFYGIDNKQQDII